MRVRAAGTQKVQTTNSRCLKRRTLTWSTEASRSWWSCRESVETNKQSLVCWPSLMFCFHGRMENTLLFFGPSLTARESQHFLSRHSQLCSFSCWMWAAPAATLVTVWMWVEIFLLLLVWKLLVTVRSHGNHGYTTMTISCYTQLFSRRFKPKQVIHTMNN